MQQTGLGDRLKIFKQGVTAFECRYVAQDRHMVGCGV